MAISKKGKRKITINSRKYLWWVFNEYDQTEFDGNQVKLIAEDQKIYFKYGLEQIDDKRYIVIALDQNRYKVHLYCPKFEDDKGLILPSGLNKMVQWVINENIQGDKTKIQHAYNPVEGILKGNARVAALMVILNELIKKTEANNS